MAGLPDSRPFDETVASADDAPSSLRASLSAQLDRARNESPAEAPKKLGEYFVLERIGSGAMGSVWACYDPKLDRKVAVKLLHADLSDAKAHVRLVGEARALARLSHPNVVTVHEVGQIEDGPHAGASFVVMEFVEGQDLEDWLEHPRGSHEIVTAFIAAGEGLWAAHQAGIVHRDFKPANVLVSAQGAVKVADFGLARAQPTGAAAGEGNTLATQGVAGTPVYMAPEQFVGGTITPAADQFAFCVSLHQALTKNLPHEGTSVMELMEAKFAESPQVRDPKDGPKGIGALLTKGLATEAENRHADMGTLLTELRALMAPPNRAVWWAAGAVALAGAAAAVAVAASPGSETAVPAPETCVGFDDVFDERWGTEQREQIEGAFAKSTVPGASSSTQHIFDALDSWRSEHVATRTELCRAYENKSISDELHDARVGCLGYRLALFDTTVGLLATADDVVVENSSPLIEGLARPAVCGSVNPVLEGIVRSRDPLEIKKGDDAMAEVAQAYVYVRAGKRDEAKQRLDALEPLLDELDDPKARGELARALSAHRPDPTRSQLLTRAAADSFRARDLQLSAWALLDLANTHRQGRRFERAREILDLAQGKADRFWTHQSEWKVEHKVEGARVLAAIAQARGDLEGNAGNPLASLPHQAESLDILEPYTEQLPGQVLAGRNNLAEVLRGLGRYAEARPLYDSAISMATRHLGDDHPDTITTLQNRGGFLIEAGRPDLGEADLLAARRRADASLPDKAFAKGLIAFNLCVTHLLHGDPDAAKTEIDTAASQWETTLPPVHPFRPFRDLFDGTVLRAQGETDRALQTQTKAYAALEAMVGPGHPLAAAAKVELAWTSAAAGKPRLALQHADAAIASLRQSGSLAGQTGATAHHAKGQAHRLLGEPELALEAVDVGVDLLERGGGPQHSGLAELLIERGRVHADLGNAEAARTDLVRGRALARSFDLDPALQVRALLTLANASGDAEIRQACVQEATALLERVSTDASELREQLDALAG